MKPIFCTFGEATPPPCYATDEELLAFLRKSSAPAQGGAGE